MNRFVIIALVVLLSSCSNTEDKGDIKDCISVMKSAESSEVVDNTLPCGLKFGMTKAEMDSCLEKQAKDPQSRLKKVGNFYHYMFEANEKLYECMIIEHALIKDKPIHHYSFVFDNSELHFSGNKDELFNNMKEEFKELDFAFCHVGDGERIDDMVYCWGYQNLAMILTDHFSLSLSFYNAPKEKPTHTIDFISRFASKVGNDLKQEDSKKKKVGEITNSPFDGSVYQVKKYLKATLKDPDSYEGISWGEVQKTNDGYSVYHKYRAKNSFGGYVVEEHVFLINENGNVQILQ